MKKKILTAILCGVFITASLAGCASPPPEKTVSGEKSESTASGTSATEISDSAAAETAAETDAAVTEQDAMNPAEKEEPQEPQTPRQDIVQPQKPAGSRQTEQTEPDTDKKQTASNPQPDNEPEPAVPVQTDPPKQSTPEPAPEEADNTPEPQPEEPPAEPAFDIGYWVAYAKSYAQGVGLELDSEAVSCWDNPIIASAGSKYLQRDLCGMLDKYSRDSDITAVWIWAEPHSGDSWDIYIGYA